MAANRSYRCFRPYYGVPTKLGLQKNQWITLRNNDQERRGQVLYYGEFTHARSPGSGIVEIEPKGWVAIKPQICEFTAVP